MTCWECAECGECYEPPAVEGSFCSEYCYHIHNGNSALNTVKNDHTKCSSCGRVRATVELPKPEEAFAVEEAYDGAYHVDSGEVTYDAFGQEESAKAAIGFRHPTTNEDGEACKCGTIARTGEGHFDVLGAIETDAILLRLRKRIKEAAIDGQREDWPSKGDLLRHYEQTGDLAYAVGASL